MPTTPTRFEPVIELSSLNGTTGVTFNGIATDDYSGNPVRGAGDVNGDGIYDILIGAPSADPLGRAQAGQTYLVFGRAGTWPLAFELASLNGNTGVIFNGIAAEDYSGNSISAAGDVNGDGISDFLIGAWYADPAGRADAGQTYLVFGHRGVWSAMVELSALSSGGGVTLNGIVAGDWSGWSLSAASDVNGGGFQDLLIGATAADPGGRTDAGQVYLVFGRGEQTSTSTTTSLVFSSELNLLTSSSSSTSVANPSEDGGSKASAGTALLLGATFGGIAGVVAVSVLLALWIRQRRHKQRVGLEGQVTSEPNVVAMEDNPLHQGTGARSWDPALYSTHQTDTVRTRDWDPASYDIHDKTGASRDWDPTLYAVREDTQSGAVYAVPRYEESSTYDEDDDDAKTSGSQGSSRTWDPSFYAVNNDRGVTATRHWNERDYEVGTQVRLGQTNV
jgi:FG-GAP repeat